MKDNPNHIVAIVDYGLGNLFSVKRACEHVGLKGVITNSSELISEASAVILPGVGAFGDAMEHLERLDLIQLLRDIALSGKPFIGICLGMQLLMTESYEFGFHHGLDLIRGSVNKFEISMGQNGKKVKVPQVGWNQIFSTQWENTGVYETADKKASSLAKWSGTLLDGLPEQEYMYFVHSYYTKPDDEGVILSQSDYSNVRFCSSLQKGNIIATQFHPERSGPQGLKFYQNLYKMVS